MADEKTHLPSPTCERLRYCLISFHFWLEPPLDDSWSICVLVEVLPAGSPRTRPLLRLTKVKLPSLFWFAFHWSSPDEPNDHWMILAPAAVEALWTTASRPLLMLLTW